MDSNWLLGGCQETGVNTYLDFTNVQLLEPWLAQLQSLHLKQGRLKRLVTGKKSNAHFQVV